jgi:hypothetical protein
MAKVEKEKGKEEKGSGHYSSHFPFFINKKYKLELANPTVNEVADWVGRIKN